MENDSEIAGLLKEIHQNQQSQLQQQKESLEMQRKQLEKVSGLCTVLMTLPGEVMEERLAWSNPGVGSLSLHKF